MVSDQGLPVGYEIFSGKQWEGDTLKPMIEKVQKNFHLNNHFKLHHL